MRERNIFTIELAGRRILIESIHEEVRNLCAEYVIDTEVYECKTHSDAALHDNADICVKTTQADIDFEREKSAQEDKLEGIPQRKFGDSYLDTLAVYRKIAEKMPDYDTVLFHGSAIEVNGEAVIFTGISGTGKSTHAKLWIDNIPGTSYINDDKPLISMERGSGVCDTADCNALGTALEQPATAGPRAIVYGTPWDGKHHRSNNTSAPIRAICILQQALENSVRELSPLDAYPMILQQTYRPRNPEQLIRTINLLNRLSSSSVSFYEVSCNLQPSAAFTAYEAIFRK